MTTTWERLHGLIGMVMSESKAIEFLDDDEFDQLQSEITGIVEVNFHITEK